MSCCPNSPQTPAPSLRALLASLLIAGNCMLLSLAVNLSAVSDTERRVLHGCVMGATVLVAYLVGGVLRQQLAQGWRQGRASVEALFVSGMVGATAYSLHSVFTAQGPVYFEVVCVLLVIYAMAHTLKQASQQQVTRAVRDALPSVQTCYRLARGAEQAGEVAVTDIRPHDEILVRAGQILPVDGRIVQGHAYINDAVMTGEALCVARQPGDLVTAGAKNLDGTLRIVATRAGNARQIDKLGEQVAVGLHMRSALEAQVERVARYFFICVALASTLTFLFWWRRGDLASAFLNGMAVLLVACPCALGFATPMGLWTAAVRLAQLGIVVRHTAAIERLAAVDTMVFDKTGTLSQVELIAEHIVLLPHAAWQPAELMAMAGVAQSMSDHPIAKAFTALPKQATRKFAPRSLKLLPGRGIEVWLDGPSGPLRLQMGDAQGLAAAHQRAPLAEAAAHLARSARCLGIFVDGDAVAVVGCMERPAPQAEASLLQLTQLGLRCEVCSGDSAERVKPWRPYRALSAMSPMDKAQHITTLTAQGRKVCFIGDGINDAAAMACSMTSMAMVPGAPLALLAADFVLAQSSLGHLAQGVQIARQSLRLVKSNLWWAAGYNSLGMAAAAAGWLHPVFAAMLMLCASLTVTLRSSSMLAPLSHVHKADLR